MTSKILVVEDDIMIGLDLVMQIEEAGYDAFGPAGTSADAVALLELHNPDLVLLDANLHGERPLRVAQALVERRIPFVYVSGYDLEYLREHLPPAPLLSKPLNPAKLIEQIRRIFEAPTERPTG